MYLTHLGVVIYIAYLFSIGVALPIAAIDEHDTVLNDAILNVLFSAATTLNTACLLYWILDHVQGIKQ